MWWSSYIKLLRCNYTFDIFVPGGGQKMVWKSVFSYEHPLILCWWLVLSSPYWIWKGKHWVIESFRQGFSSYCDPGASGLRQIKALILNFDFLNLCATYRNTSLYWLETFDLKSAQSFYAVREATKALLFSWEFFFFSCWKASEVLVGNMSCDCPRAQGCLSHSACRH